MLALHDRDPSFSKFSNFQGVSSALENEFSIQALFKDLRTCTNPDQNTLSALKTGQHTFFFLKQLLVFWYTVGHINMILAIRSSSNHARVCFLEMMDVFLLVKHVCLWCPLVAATLVGQQIQFQRKLQYIASWKQLLPRIGHTGTEYHTQL